MGKPGLLDFAVQYSGIIGVFVTVLIALIGMFHYLSMKRAEERGRQYDRYHKLLEDLNASPRGDAPFIDRQVAVVYEMRNFPEYYPVTLRILERSMPRWESLRKLSASVPGSVNTLYEEAQLTIKFIKRRQLEMQYFLIAEEDR